MKQIILFIFFITVTESIFSQNINVKVKTSIPDNLTHQDIKMTLTDGNETYEGYTDENGVVEFTDVLVDIKEEQPQFVPNDYKIVSGWPNPVSSSTPQINIKYQVAPKKGQSNVKLAIYDVLGREVKTLVSDQLSKGQYQTAWNGTNIFGQRVAAGVYVYRMIADGEVRTGKISTLESFGGGNSTPPNEYLGSFVPTMQKQTHTPTSVEGDYLLIPASVESNEFILKKEGFEGNIRPVNQTYNITSDTTLVVMLEYVGKSFLKVAQTDLYNNAVPDGQTTITIDGNAQTFPGGLDTLLVAVTPGSGKSIDIKTGGSHYGWRIVGSGQDVRSQLTDRNKTINLEESVVGELRVVGDELFKPVWNKGYDNNDVSGITLVMPPTDPDYEINGDKIVARMGDPDLLALPIGPDINRVYILTGPPSTSWDAPFDQLHDLADFKLTMPQAVIDANYDWFSKDHKEITKMYNTRSIHEGTNPPLIYVKRASDGREVLKAANGWHIITPAVSSTHGEYTDLSTNRIISAISRIDVTTPHQPNIRHILGENGAVYLMHTDSDLLWLITFFNENSPFFLEYSPKDHKFQRVAEGMGPGFSLKEP